MVNQVVWSEAMGQDTDSLRQFDVDDIDTNLAQATTPGAAVLMPTTQLPDQSLIAVFTDPEGRPIDLVQEAAA